VPVTVRIFIYPDNPKTSKVLFSKTKSAHIGESDSKNKLPIL